VYASEDPLDPTRAPPLKSGVIKTHDGKTTYNIVIRGKNEEFPPTKSVLADNAAIVRSRARDKERHMERKLLEEEEKQKLGGGECVCETLDEMAATTTNESEENEDETLVAAACSSDDDDDDESDGSESDDDEMDGSESDEIDGGVDARR
jgi:hypothetical protein